GAVRVGGVPLGRSSSAAAIRAGISLLPEDRKAEGIVPGLSVRENIVLAALPRLSRAGIVSRARQDRVVDIFMKRLRIKASSPEQKVGELSGGNQQKVLLARWLCLEPKVLLLDEPTRGIDVGAKAEVQALIDELAQEGLAVLLVSSDIEELVEGADRIVVLRSGATAGELVGENVSEDALLAALADHTAPADAAEPAGAPQPPDAAHPGTPAPADTEAGAPGAVPLTQPAGPGSPPDAAPTTRRAHQAPASAAEEDPR
ncbi:ATP-binding cassette domain-containing protein, partial [Streptomyces hydrogenans]|uniref:ATP-binding cassette domain-containing protein n=1 Tax=Streptomyces hydrogenans TaxID=1873719 RepID=UPI0035D86073